ncbi:Short-chain dehydrogenase/reductase SDR [Lasiodiplodia theobromae]|uniref:Short-chain dehydrogenase/reductase SDR n=1 Tax=Lasiodiplodia theobromae TaxID=45133 RepID=UPI0015C3422A|nr:Short-chain dehydrogenase/reductase SDR [Lasiodiplodia theobromae]KAF4544511.1 Short-chain dehydrogenase/reductase SDR [Lasiodiplodia theobromae]
MASYLITGTSRGIGLTLVTMLAAKPTSEVAKVYAAARSESEALKKVIASAASRVVFVPLEVTSQDSIKAAAAKVDELQAGKGLDVLINNAGIMEAPVQVDQCDDLPDVLNVNVVGVHNVTRAFLPQLRKGTQKKIINISSGLGSMGWAHFTAPHLFPAYKVSKAALNMLTVQYAQLLEKDDFTVVAITPGWLRTDLGSSQADLSVEEGAQATLNILMNATPKISRKFFNIHAPGWENKTGFSKYDGSEIPW